MTKLRESNFRLMTAWNLVSYACAALALGAIAGCGMGHYQIQRFRLLRFRHTEIQNKIIELENKLKTSQELFEQNMKSTVILKKRQFSNGCFEAFGESEQKPQSGNVYQYYEKEPQLFRAISGIQVSTDDKTGTDNNCVQNAMTNKMTFFEEVDDFFKFKVKKWQVKSWSERPDQFSKCYIAVPGADFD